MSLITIYVPTSIHLQELNNVLQPGLLHDFHSQPSTFKNQNLENTLESFQSL